MGRFAPSPSGPLHLGSAAAALASYLDARAHAGLWLLRIEDIDSPRTVAGAADLIQDQLRFLGLHWDGLVTYQSQRTSRYQDAFERLKAADRVFGCACSRREIADSIAARDPPAVQRHHDPIYPGTCRHGIRDGRAARAWRFRIANGSVSFHDRWLGPQQQEPAGDAGDFVIRRADGPWAYQLAVTVDDADAGVTHVVRGQDILGSTGRQIQLQQALGLPTPAYLHIPLAVGSDGDKLSKQNGAASITGSAMDDLGADPCRLLQLAAHILGLEPAPVQDRERWLAQATDQWAARFV